MTEGQNQSPHTRRMLGLRRVLATVIALSLSAGAQAQNTLDLDFRPPDIRASAICVSPPTDDETTDYWGQWDKRVLPDRTMRSIRRDMSRLTQIDGVRWFDVTKRAMDLLEKSDPAFVGETALVMRITALDAAGKFEELTSSKLVVDLANLIEVMKPVSKMVLSRYLKNGIGIDADPELAERLLLEAGFAGEPKALLALAKLQLADKAPKDWIVPLKLGVTTAFSNMVGELDPQICDRTSRIATQYRLGGIVTADPQLAHDWYRFTADLGSGHAAWKVVEYHIRAETFQKSNDLLLSYLEMAAAEDLSYAQIELARVLERGALAPEDLSRAFDLYRAASLSGDLRGLSQYALFLRRHETAMPAYRDLRIATLKEIISRNDTPGWALSQLAETVLQDQGRWAGAPQARVLLEQAVERGNLDGHVLLSRLILAQNPDVTQVDEAVDMLARVVTERGGAQPMTMIRAALVCRADTPPDRAAADYWLQQKLAIGVSDSAEQHGPLLGLEMEADWPRIAEIQSFALSGSPDGLAMWRRLIKDAAFADDDMRAFWETYFEQTDGRLVGQAKLDLTLTSDPKTKEIIYAALRERHLTSGPDFAAWLNRELVEGMYAPATLDQLGTTARARAVAVLEGSSSLGYGRAMFGLAALSTDPAQRQALFENYHAVIDRDGDYAAQLFAVRYSDAPNHYMTRAAGVMPCGFGGAMEMIAFSEELGETGPIDRWLQVADVLAAERTSWMISLARTYLRGGDPDKIVRAFDLFTQASARGDTRADGEIFRMIVTKHTPIYDPTLAVTMLSNALEAKNFAILGSYLSALRSADPGSRTLIEGQVDMPMLYQLAAETGDPVAMRIHGLVLRESAVTSSDLSMAMRWLAEAAKAGDTIAMTEFGEALAFGIGVTVDREQALGWLQRAAALGSKKAQEITRLVNLSGGVRP